MYVHLGLDSLGFSEDVSLVVHGLDDHSLVGHVGIGQREINGGLEHGSGQQTLGGRVRVVVDTANELGGLLGGGLDLVGSSLGSQNLLGHVESVDDESDTGSMVGQRQVGEVDHLGDLGELNGTVLELDVLGQGLGSLDEGLLDPGVHLVLDSVELSSSKGLVDGNVVENGVVLPLGESGLLLGLESVLGHVEGVDNKGVHSSVEVLHQTLGVGPGGAGQRNDGLIHDTDVLELKTLVLGGLVGCKSHGGVGGSQVAGHVERPDHQPSGGQCMDHLCVDGNQSEPRGYV